MLAAAHPLVHVNASLNMVATLLLIAGLVLIKQRKEVAHKQAMMAAFLVSCLFLACYCYYHFVIKLQTPFGGEGFVRYVYFAILISHVLLAFTVPFLVPAAILFGQRGMGRWLPKRIATADETTRAGYIASMRALHRRVVKFAFPIWLYVSVTGVIVYLMLYHLWPSADLG